MKNTRHKTQDTNGFSLLETMIAITVLLVAIMGPYTLATQSIAASNRAKNQTIAFFLAEEPMEFIHNIRDSNSFAGTGWLNGLSNCRSPNQCYIDFADVSDPAKACAANCPKIRFDSSTGLYNYTTGDATIFSRTTRIIETFNDREARVITTISWEERYGTQSFILEGTVLNWP